jgi:hypothetical protein
MPVEVKSRWAKKARVTTPSLSRIGPYGATGRQGRSGLGVFYLGSSRQMRTHHLPREQKATTHKDRLPSENDDGHLDSRPGHICRLIDELSGFQLTVTPETADESVSSLFAPSLVDHHAG